MKYHYVYRITNKLLNKHYYGIRSSINAPKLDLGINYFSSSKDKDFIKDQKENPQNYKYKIVKAFENRKDALTLEIILHAKFNVGVNESFYNKCKQTSVGYDTEGTKRSEESKKKQGDTIRGQKRPIEWGQKISNALKNHPAYKTDEFRLMRRQKTLGENNHNYGKLHSDEHKRKISETLINNDKVTCPHCQKIGSYSPMQRWHFNNCKKLIIADIK